jgi:hypothetical protein
LANTSYVGFEDEVGANYPGGFADFNYTDEVYAFTGTTAAVPDLAGTLPLLGIGLTSLAAFGRRFRK